MLKQLGGLRVRVRVGVSVSVAALVGSIIEIGAKLPNYAKIAQYGDHCHVRFETALVNSPS